MKTQNYLRPLIDGKLIAKKVFVTIFPLLILAFHAKAQTKIFQVDHSGTLTNGLVSYYKLENENDFWSTNNLTNNGSISFNSAKINNGATLSMSTKWLNTNSSLGLDGTHSFSYAAWIKITTSGAEEVIASHGDVGFGNAEGTQGQFAWLFRVVGTNKLEAVFERNNQEYTGTITGTTTLNVNTWYHVALVWTPGGTSRIYLNGLADGSAILTGSGTEQTIPIRVGSRGTSSPIVGWWDGQFDEIGYWCKVLSPQEISDLYNSGKGQTMCTVGVDCPTHNPLFFGNDF